MGITILVGLAVAVCWGLPGVALARATRSVGSTATVIGAIAIGLAVTFPLAFFVDLPDISLRGALLILLMGTLTLIGYLVAFSAFRVGKVSVVAPIIACEGAIAAVIAIAFGESMDQRVLIFLPIAVIGVVLAAMNGSSEGTGGVMRASIAAVIWGFVLVLAAPVADEVGVVWAFLLVRLVALLFAIPLGIRAGVTLNARLDWKNVAIWGLGDSAASLLFVVAADRGPVALAGVLAAQFATVGAIAGVLILKERLRARQWAGIVIVILSVTAIAAVSAL